MHLESDVTSALNDLWCGGSDGTAFSHERESLAQECVHGRVAGAVASFGPPPANLTGPGALEALRVCGPGGYECDAQGARAAYDQSLLALPMEGTVPTPLQVLWGEGGREFVGDFCQTKILPSDLSEERLEALGLDTCYTDPSVKKPKNWCQFLRRLHSTGVVEFVMDDAAEMVGVFFVRKKNGDLRMVVDCRRSNAHFAPPAGVQLCSGSALSQLELGPNDTLFCAQCDIQTAFYHMELPLELRKFFGLEGGTAADLGVTHIGGKAVKPSTWILPTSAIL